MASPKPQPRGSWMRSPLHFRSKPAARPIWWQGEHAVVLEDGDDGTSANSADLRRSSSVSANGYSFYNNMSTDSFDPASVDHLVSGFSFMSTPGHGPAAFQPSPGFDFTVTQTPHRDQVFVVPVRGSETPMTRARLPGLQGSETPDVARKLAHAATENVQDVALHMYRLLKQNGMLAEAEKAFQRLHEDGSSGRLEPGGDEFASKGKSGMLVGMDFVMKDGIVNYLRDVAKLTPPVPRQVVRFGGISYSAQLLPQDQAFETFGKKVYNITAGLLLNPFLRDRPKAAVTYEILHDVDGYIMPGSMTLLLGPPGSGKTSLLKVLAGRAETSKTVKLDGWVKYNERDASEVVLTRLIAYINGQLNKHLPYLTVRETLEFAGECTQGLRPKNFSPQLRKFFAHALVEGQDPYLEYILHVLGLKGIENEIVGNPGPGPGAGITDNDRNRLTTAEIAMGTYAVMLYDQPCSGQESLATYDLVSTLRAISRFQQCSAVMSLVQLSQEVFDLFDRVILLGEGRILYQGPRQDALHYFEELGFVKPAHVDSGEFLQEIAAGEGSQYVEDGLPVPHLQDLVKAYRNSELRRDVMRIVTSDEVLHTFWVESEPNLGLSVRKAERAEHLDDGSTSKVFFGPEVVVAKLSGNVDHSRGIESTGNIQVGDVVTAISSPAGGMQYLAVGSQDHQTNQAARVSTLLSNARGHVRLQVQRTLETQSSGEDGEELVEGQFSKEHVLRWWPSTLTLIKRQLKVTKRLTILIQLRLLQVLILSLVAGTIFKGLGGKPGILEMNAIRGLGFVSTMGIMLINSVQAPVYMMQRPIFYKQRDQRFFRASSYVVAHSAISLPQSIIEGTLYCVCVYFGAGLSTKDGGLHFFVYWGLLCSIAFFGSCLFFLLSGISPILEAANALGGLLVSIFLLFSGFLIYPHNIPKWWKWMYYANPIHWANMAFCITQIGGSTYKDSCQLHLDLPFCEVYPDMQTGKAYLKYYQLKTGSGWILVSFAVILGWTVLILILAHRAISRLRYTELNNSLPQEKTTPMVLQVDESSSSSSSGGDSHVGSHFLSKQQREGYDEEACASDQEGMKGWPNHHIPVTPVAISFHDLTFTSKDAKGQSQVILSKVSGYCKSGAMLALLGGTKSGKTSLLKCLANRASHGEQLGEILVNGYKPSVATFSRISGFAEKLDAHQPFLTVKESLRFSAILRLGNSVYSGYLEQHVELILELLDLHPVSEHLVGSLRDATGRTYEIAKKITIAVELAANPSVLFLDEPTSGMDSIGARNILQAMQIIASTGRTVISTIQHPSARMLSAFSSVLILRPGGEQAYFGPVGWNCTDLLRYFTSIPKVPEYHSSQNAITYVLDILGAGIRRRAPVHDFATVYRESRLGEENSKELGKLRRKSRRHVIKDVDTAYAASYWKQAAMVFLRTQKFLWRNVQYTFGRLTASISIGLLLGSLYFQIGEKDSFAVTSRSLFVYIQIMLIGVVTANNIIPQIGTDRLAYFRERRARMYAAIFYPISWALAEIPYLLIATLVFVAIGNGMAGIATDSLANFVQYWLGLFLFTLAVTYFGMLLTIATPVPILAAFAVSIISSLWITASGVVVPKLLVPNTYTWLFWANPYQYVTNTLTSISFFCDTKQPPCLACPAPPHSPCPACPCERFADLDGEFVWDRLSQLRSLDYSRIGLDFVSLGGMSLMFASLAFVSFMLFRHNRP